MNVEDFRRDIRNAGALGAGIDLGYRLTNKLTTFMILQTMKLLPRLPAPTWPVASEGIHHRFLNESELRRYAREPVNDMTDGFLDEALAKGDRCSAIMDGNRLVSYVWCARKPTLLTRDLLLEFDTDWVYRYKAFTIPAYRGRRLHGMNSTMAMRDTVGLGLKGCLCYVDVNNYSSRKSLYRQGYVDVGKMFALRITGVHLIRVDPRCRAYGLGLKPL